MYDDKNIYIYGIEMIQSSHADPDAYVKKKKKLCMLMKRKTI